MFSPFTGFIVQIVGPGELRGLAQACAPTSLCRCRYIYHFGHSTHVVSIKSYAYWREPQRPLLCLPRGMYMYVIKIVQ